MPPLELVNLKDNTSYSTLKAQLKSLLTADLARRGLTIP